ncbi:MAG: mechanosensitive ion channel [Bacteroidaceae bacterium]|nr:mechanosensitive ion channel [Bacteroidaceae bacterium]
MDGFIGLFTWGTLLSAIRWIAKPLIIFAICKIVMQLAVKVSGKLLSKSKLDKGVTGFISSAVKIALWCFTIILVADSVGVNTSSLVTVLGVVSLALSLAFQNIMTNVFSGITILMSKPFVVGQYVQIGAISGTVRDISLMRTTLVTPDNKIEMIPNGDICASNVTNFSAEPERRVDLTVSVSYDAPTQVVKDAVLEVLNGDSRVKQDTGKEPFVRLSAYNANDISYTIRVWVDSADYWNVYFDTLENLRTSFAKHNIEFSYPHTVVHLEK